MQRYIDFRNISPYLICSLCNGFLVDATTIVECLHSFCKSCIIHHLEVSYNCPKCNTEIHKTKPLEYIKSDPCLQEIVYKLVPNLYADEENRRNEWKRGKEKNKDPGPSKLADEQNEDSRILVTFKYFRGTSRMERIKTEQVLQLFPTRYLCCQPDMPIHVLKKFVQHKFDISPDLFEIDLWRGDETLLDELSLKQLVQIYGLFRDRKPLELHFSLYPKSDNISKNENDVKSANCADDTNTVSCKTETKSENSPPNNSADESISDTYESCTETNELQIHETDHEADCGDSNMDLDSQNESTEKIPVDIISQKTDSAPIRNDICNDVNQANDSNVVNNSLENMKDS